MLSIFHILLYRDASGNYDNYLSGIDKNIVVKIAKLEKIDLPSYKFVPEKNAQDYRDRLNGNIDNTAAKPSTSADNKVEGAPGVNGGVESKDITIKEKIMKSDEKQLNEEDFEIVYKSICINQNTKIDDITKEFGFPEGYEANNQGYISGNAKYRRWNLCYPSYDNPEIQIIVLSERQYIGEEVKDGNSYIAGIYLESCETQKGLKVGDNLGKVLQLYGKPKSIENNVLRYPKGTLHIEAVLDETMEKVESIFTDYNM